VASKIREKGFGEEANLRPYLFSVERVVGEKLVKRRLVGAEREERRVEMAGGGACQAGDLGGWR
jgi:hypothetical protein